MNMYQISKVGPMTIEGVKMKNFTPHYVRTGTADDGILDALTFEVRDLDGRKYRVALERRDVLTMMEKCRDALLGEKK